MIGTKWGRLTVTGRAANRNGQCSWICLCECGKESIVRGAALRNGTIQSCGEHRPKPGAAYCVDCSAPITVHARRCRRCDSRIKERRHIHGHAKRKAKLPEYQIWGQMKGKCFRQSHESYKNYSARGITVCEEWCHNFQAFYDYVGPRPTPKHTIERINNDGNYEPGNVKWATRYEQNRNQRSNVNLTIDGVTRCVEDWARVSGTNSRTIYTRHKAGWPDREAVFRPPDRRSFRRRTSPSGSVEYGPHDSLPRGEHVVNLRSTRVRESSEVPSERKRSL